MSPDAPLGIIARAGETNLSFDGNLFNRLLEERIIFLGSEVNAEVANRVCGQLLLLAAADPVRDVHLYINSPGGSVDAGLAICDTMDFIENDVSTLVVGLAASMGQVLSSAGTKGKRFALPHSRIMMHQPLGGIQGVASDVAIQAEQMLYVKRVLREETARHTGKSVDEIEADADRDRWFTADEAVNYGLIDRVVSRATHVPDGAGTRG
ncbi:MULTISPECIES: ATP-dependent Clp protease proteolytic subunit [unclassified Micromonospora]|uniref:ATP-dependent Clp protease proteolytic subunit n=1 Tax=unclassified Micromonospora TaxID=2617518 RepID=UPI0009D10A9B|nr:MULTISPECIES: ATP-dependent Clp protease proteolytic subunit [unclassified Micromonospora]MDI5939655.1 ATP-dependent Clp protease proteolytic subunit [Micromonospora sp. DH15]OON30627.1 ATP-dependent Clp protease proteolytic subunit [Micromonospora sp. Rc5]